MKSLTDVHLVVYISIASLFPLSLLIISTVVDHHNQIASKRFIFSGNDPHFTEHFYCSNNHTVVWTLLYYSWIGALLVIVLVLAI